MPQVSQSQVLQSALRVYKLVLNALADGSGYFNLAGSNLTHLMLALVSNMGHIMAYHARHEDAIECLDLMEHFWTQGDFLRKRTMARLG